MAKLLNITKIEPLFPNSPDVAGGWKVVVEHTYNYEVCYDREQDDYVVEYVSYMHYELKGTYPHRSFQLLEDALFFVMSHAPCDVCDGRGYFLDGDGYEDECSECQAQGFLEERKP